MFSKYDFIKDINPTKEDWGIKVRMIRCWKVPNFHRKNFDDNVDMILMDEHGGKIHATVKGTLQVRKKIREGDVYFVKNFGVGLNADMFRPTGHEYRLSFNLRTDVKSTFDASIPDDGFDFVDFELIEKEAPNSPYLVGVVGLLTRVGDVVEHVVSGRKTKMIVLELGNLMY
ncbi:replication protein A 70 kDa DNA-binding subunit D-like [Gastrolobium bilobum]|uniref:replication protein A 70 kDa DNA-binding subunit D-like n=1 Tax=Gastrolobium bilobum TaxID=150636 RepID=UPI002AB02CB3|nr:replication protein A 70 kDa DNA-binding subunit D-like [Gastrolobium bilobum]